MKQLDWFKRGKEAYGGDLLTKRKERARPRPLSTKDSMHLVLKSTQAKGEWSFRKHPQLIERLLYEYAKKYGVKIYDYANVGNHIHAHIKLSNRHTYASFIRALTGTIALLVTGARRLTRRFWDRRPYTRIVHSRRAVFHLRDYIKINQLEGSGCGRSEAESRVRGSA